MENAVGTNHRVCFKAFELDLDTRELYRNGIRLRVQGQPIDVLEMLLERPGELVTREALRKKLWPEDTFVDFEHSLNSAVTRLRDALGDRSEKPRYIETLPRLGYRLIVPQRNETQDFNRPPSEVIAESIPASARIGPRLHRYPQKRLLPAIGAIALIGVSALAMWYLRRPLPPPRIESIAVLPFANLSGDPAQEYFADGMTEELITELGTSGSIRVVSRTSVMRYKGSRKPLPEIARELGVDGIVEGTVTRSENHVRITANLLQASSDRHLWAQRYESEVENILVVQSKVSHAVVDAIGKALTRQERPATAPRRVNAESYQAYLEGRYHFNKMSRDGLKKAEVSFRRSIDLDRTFAPAYGAIAILYGWEALNGVRPAAVVSPLAKAAASKAVELDGQLAEAHTAMGFVMLLYDWDWEGAEKELEFAVRLNPSSAEAHEIYAAYLTAMGRGDEAIREGQEAVRLDPASPMSNISLAWCLYFPRRHDEAIAQLARVLELEPRTAWANMELGWNYAGKRMYPQAITECRVALDLMPNDLDILGTCGDIYGLAVQKSEAHLILRRLEKVAEQEYVDPYHFALVYAGLGDTNRAMDQLESAYREHSALLFLLNVDPRLDPLRSAPRFLDLLHRLKFPPQH